MLYSICFPCLTSLRRPICFTIHNIFKILHSINSLTSHVLICVTQRRPCPRLRSYTCTSHALRYG
jgi:hypothetical protein